MNTCGGRLRIFSVLFVVPTICILIHGIPIKKVQLSPWDDDTVTFRISTTRSPFFREKHTVSPDESEYKHHSYDTDPALWVIVGGPLLMCFLFLLFKFLICKECDNYDSAETSHRLSALDRPQNRNQRTFQNRARPQNTINSYRISERTLHISSLRDHAGQSRTSGRGGKPPAYSEVVLSDMSGKDTKFPEVYPKPPETPPPKYDDRILLRY